MKTNLEKGIKELGSIRMTDEEKGRMLQNILKTPVESPFVKRAAPYTFFFSHTVRVAFATCLIAVVSVSTFTYASNGALPGDMLYPLKVSVLEPTLDVVNRSPERRIEWQAEKVDRRIMEAEALAEINALDEKKSLELERRVEESSRAFVEVVEEVEKDEGDRERRKQEFRKKFEVVVEAEVEAENAGEAEFGTFEATSADEELDRATSTDDEEEEGKKEDENNDNGKRQERKSKNSDSREKIKNLKRKALEALERRGRD